MIKFTGSNNKMEVIQMKKYYSMTTFLTFGVFNINLFLFFTLENLLDNIGCATKVNNAPIDTTRPTSPNDKPIS